MSTEPAIATGRVAFLGGGFMGEGIIQGLLARGAAAADQITVCELLPGRRSHLQQRYGVQATAEHLAAVRGADLVVIAVKPQEFDKLARDLTGGLGAEQIVVSIMAGVTLSTLYGALQHDRLVRAMPNTPGGIGEGFTGWTATPAVDGAGRERVAGLLAALGGAAYFADEGYLDMTTAVSGSGPGFVMLFVEAMIEAAVQIGLRREVATEMVLHTVAGTARFALQTGRQPADVRYAVTSPGGTTAAGLQALEKGAVRGAVAEAVIAAFERSRALGG